MSSSILEQIRVNHELSELYEDAICKELDEKPVGVRSMQWCTFFAGSLPFCMPIHIVNLLSLSHRTAKSQDIPAA
jgi:hypothetical protein